MVYQHKSNLPQKFKVGINVYRILRKNIDGLDLTEKQVLGLVANEAQFYKRIEALKRQANRNLNQKQIDILKKQIDGTRKKYGII